MIWTWIRYLLVLCSAVPLILFLKALTLTSSRPPPGPLWIGFVIAAALILNIVYLLVGVHREQRRSRAP